MSELSDELLVAYVDGQLGRAQSLAIEKVLEQDEVIAARVDALKEAHRRLQYAFDAILAGAVGDVMATVPTLPPPPVSRPRGNGGLTKVGVATACVGLALAALVAGYGWPLVGPERIGSEQSEAQAPQVTPAPNWKDAALGAHALLARASVEVNPESQSNRDLVAFQIAQSFGVPVKLPDLQAQGFKFNRGQLLRFGDAPLAEILYLGAAKPPLALYAMRGGGGEAKPAYRKIGAGGALDWSDDGIDYLLAGEEDEPTLRRIAERIKAESPGPATGSSGPDPVVTGSH